MLHQYFRGLGGACYAALIMLTRTFLFFSSFFWTCHLVQQSKTFQLSHDLVRVRTIRETVAAVWTMFDTDGGGGIDREEFVKRDGFADTIIASTT